MGFNENPFLSPLFKLFGKKLAGVPPSPIAGDFIQFNSVSNEWELTPASATGQANTSSNVGSGDGLALPKVGVDLPFKTLVDGIEIVITVSATELTFSIGAIAISKITGLQVILDSKIETLTNVGGFNEIAKAKVGQNVDIRTLKAGTNVSIIQNANDLEISATDSGEVNTASNVGTGVDVFRLKVLQDLEFRTLLANAEILITQNALDLAFSIGAIAQSKITGLVSALASKIETITNIGGASEIAKAKVGQNVDLRTLLANAEILITTNVSDLAFSIGAIAQSKITGLVTALGTKIDTIVNVGTGAGKVFRDKVGTTMNLKSIKAGAGISVVNNADDIEIISTGGGAGKAFLPNVFDILEMSNNDFIPCNSQDASTGTESDNQIPIPMDCKLQKLIITIESNGRSTITNFNLRVNGVTVNQTIAIPASTSGTFQDSVNTDDVSALDKIAYQSVFGAGGGVITLQATNMEILAQ